MEALNEIADLLVVLLSSTTTEGDADDSGDDEGTTADALPKPEAPLEKLLRLCRLGGGKSHARAPVCQTPNIPQEILIVRMRLLTICPL